MKTLIKNGIVVSSSLSEKKDLLIENGKILGLYNPEQKLLIEADRIIDASGKYIIPGVIDEHVHFNDPGTTFREDFEHGTAACAVGGITTAIAMPTNTPLVLSMDSLNQTIQAYEGRGYVDYAIHGGIDLSNADLVEELWMNSGITAIKAFMCYSSPDMGWIRDDILYKTMKMLASHNGTIIIHAENNELISLAESNLKANGQCDGHAHCQSHPKQAEVEAIQRVIYFVQETGVTTLIPHVSTAEGLALIHDARAKGIPVYAETCAQYLTFTEDDVQEMGPFLKFTPPVHSEENRKGLLDLIKKGYVNTIGSDHSPYAEYEKTPGLDCIWDAPNGIPGLEVLLPSLLNLVNENVLTLESVVRMTSETPAALYQLPGKGRLEPGYDADLVIIDMEKTFIYEKEMIQSKNKWTPYLNRTFKGCPVLTMVRGEVVAEDFHLTGTKGFGKLIQRKK